MELERAIDKFKRNAKVESWYQAIDALYHEDRAVALPYLKEFRRELTADVKSDPERNMRLLKGSYVLGARDSFDDYMIAMEWDRSANAKFWLPRRRVLEGQHKIATQIQDFIDSDDKLLTLSTPPGCGKTTLIKFLLSYIGGKFPDSMNMYCSYSDGMVKLMYDSLQSMMCTEEYNFHNIFELSSPDCSSEYHTVSYRRKGDAPTLGLVAIGGSVTGRTRANKFFVTDDLVKNSEVAMSPERLQKLWDDYSNTLTTRMIGDDVKQIMLGTVWSKYDPISRTREKYEGKEGRVFIAIPVKDAEGHSNFNYDHPDRYTDERIKEIENDLDPGMFSALYMQRGLDKEGMAFAKDRLRYYNGTLPEGDPDKIIFHGDVAWGGGDSFSVPFAYVYGDDVYIHDVMFDRSDKSVTKPRLVGKILKNRPNKGNLEANNGGDILASEIDEILRRSNYSMTLTSKKAKGNMNKMVRIEQHQDSIRRFYFRSPECRDKEYSMFMEELTVTSLTGKNLHDDAADSLAGLCDEMYNGVGQLRVLKRPSWM